MAERISDAEWQVMEVLWDEAPLTASDVVSRLTPASGWSPATVKTLLGRLLTKGALVHEEDGRRYLYRPKLKRDAYEKGESQRLVDRLFGGRATPLVAHLAQSGQLSASDIAELEALVRELKK
jgi:predicted transcriptional regulator